MDSTGNLKKALHQWKELLGAEQVLTDSRLIEKSETATFLTVQKISAVIRPENVEQVQGCLRIANEMKIPIYPISRGRNCGYGSKVPYQTESVVLDLSRMNRILHYDEDLAYVILEPGVTQEQLSIFLKDKGNRLWMDPVATFPDCSVIGNILERGHGMTPAADRISRASDFEVVLPTGERIQTGFSAFPNAKTAGLDRWAPGPQLDGLFSQSNLGVVTRMSLWLLPAPEFVRSLGFSLSTPEQFAKAIDLLRPLSFDGTLKFGPRFFNEHRLIQTFSKYPWNEMQGKTPLSMELLEKLQLKFNVPLWTGIVGLYGSREQVEVNERRVREALSGLTESFFIMDTDSQHTVNPRLENFFERFIKASFSPMCGQVGSVTQRPRWRKKENSVLNSADWSEDKCGIIWCPVSSPFRGKETVQAVQVYRKTVSEFGFEPDMSVSVIRERSLEINASIVFDREDSEQELKALKCAESLLERLADVGFYPHRLGLPTMRTLNKVSPELQKTWSQLKRVLDPNEILAPGRYGPQNRN